MKTLAAIALTMKIRRRQSRKSTPSCTQTQRVAMDLSQMMKNTVCVCIGSRLNNNSQNMLFKSLPDMKKVRNKLQPEPTNQYGARVIAFMCHIDSKWQRIGYVVHECLEHVHKALSLDWVKYLVVLVLFWTWLLHWHTCVNDRRVAS